MKTRRHRNRKNKTKRRIMGGFKGPLVWAQPPDYGTPEFVKNGNEFKEQLGNSLNVVTNLNTHLENAALLERFRNKLLVANRETLNAIGAGAAGGGVPAANLVGHGSMVDALNLASNAAAAGAGAGVVGAVIDPLSATARANAADTAVAAAAVGAAVGAIGGGGAANDEGADEAEWPL